MPMYDNSDWRCNPEELDPCLAAEVRIKNDLLDIRQSKCLLCFILAILTTMLLVATVVVLAYSGHLPNRFVGFPLPENPPSKLEQPPIVPIHHTYDQFNAGEDSRDSKSSYGREVTLLPPIDDGYPIVESFTSRYYYLAPENVALPMRKMAAELKYFSFSTAATILITPSSTTSTSTTPMSTTNLPSPVGHVAIKLKTTKAPSAIRWVPLAGGVGQPKTAAPPTVDKANVGGVSENLLAFPYDYINTKEKLEDCTRYRLAGYKNSGVYYLSTTVDGAVVTFPALCLMDTVDERIAWTVFHRRTGPELAYWNATFAEYADGFGDPRFDYWLGLDRLHALIVNNASRSSGSLGVTMRIVVDGRKCSIYECGERGLWWGDWEFAIGSRAKLFNVTHVRYLRGNISSSNIDYFSSISRHQAFTTVDSDNDKRPNGNSAAFRMKGGWWHQDFTFASLNGAYGSGTKVKFSEGQSWYWRDGDGVSYYIKPIISLMMFRREP